MQSAYTVLILLMLVGVSRLIGRLVPLPLPLVQIGAGAVLAWPSLGCMWRDEHQEAETISDGLRRSHKDEGVQSANQGSSFMSSLCVDLPRSSDASGTLCR